MNRRGCIAEEVLLGLDEWEDSEGKGQVGHR